jgi:hypothetical protein
MKISRLLFKLLSIHSILFLPILLHAQNVGIDIANPVFKLDVRNGSINVDSVYRINTFTVLSIKGASNTFIGRDAGKVNTGPLNTFSGDHAGYSNLSGFYNSFFGESAGSLNTSGYYNSFFGGGAGINNTTGFSNSFYGKYAGHLTTTGDNNSFFGESAGSGNTTGTGNTLIGFSANLNNGGLTNASAFGANARVDCSNCMVLGSKNGINGAMSGVRVGIGLTAPIARLHVADSSVVFSSSGFIGTGSPPIQGAGSRMMWFADKSSFRTGYVSGNQWDKDSIGIFSFASGFSTKAKGPYATAIGSYTTASGPESVSMGYGCTAQGQNSLAAGRNSLASGAYSMTFGFNTMAKGTSSIAMGYETKSTAPYTTSMGFSSIASGNLSTAFGYSTIAKGYSAFVIGMFNDSILTTNQTNIESTSPLFIIGNGDGSMSRTNAMVVLKNGNTGIGISNPAFKLDVNGSINVASNYRIDQNVILEGYASNLFIGDGAGIVTSNIDNTFCGYRSGYSNTDGFSNCFFGVQSGYLNTSGIGNSFFGPRTGLNNSSGDENSFFGGAAGLFNTTGVSNSFFGYVAGHRNTTGNANSFVGYFAGYDNISGTQNIAVGDSADFGTGSLTNATVIGSNAQVDCSNCMVLGSVNGVNGATSNVNVGIGTNTPGFPLNFSQMTGDKISLFGTSGAHYGFGIQGYLLQIHTDEASADIAFGYGSSASFTERMRIQGNGNVGIGITNPNAPLGFPATLGKKITLYPGGTGDVGMAVQGNQFLIYSDHPNASVRLGYDQSGVFQYNFDVYGNGNATLRGALTQNSDLRLKRDLLPLENSLQKITKLNGYHYYWKDDNYDDDLQIGMIAQEIQKFYPELVKEDSDGILSVNYSGLIPVMIESIKEQQKQIDHQQQQIDELKKMLMTNDQGQTTKNQ